MTTLNKIPDYTGNREHAKDLARRLQDYYHAQGYTDVRAWVESTETPSGRKIFCTRSNIIFDLSKLPVA